MTVSITNKKLEKLRALGNFEVAMKLSDLNLGDVYWWLNSAMLSNRHMSHGPVDLELATDASKQG